MIKPITFCISTARNEKDYISLLLDSLKNNIDTSIHEILIFIDSDNQNTYEYLLELQESANNIRICKNKGQFPIGSQTNVTLMFNSASNDIVCYLQSDMVVGKDLDKHIVLNLQDKNEILSITRIEPPLHPESDTTITKNFGFSPTEFNMTSFNQFVEDRQKNDSGVLEDVYFAPFAVFKETWFQVLGGFDTQFRCSREDSDILVRAKLAGLKLKQSWNAMVYHFTCVSSRGKEWFRNTESSQYNNELQQKADTQELIRFTRKWGKFSHDIKYMYNISMAIELDTYADINILLNIEPYTNKIYLTNSKIQKYLISTLDFTHSYVSNLRWGYTEEHWDSCKSRFLSIDFEDKVKYVHDVASLVSDNSHTNSDDILLFVKYSEMMKNINESFNIIQSLQDIIHENDEGLYEYGPFTIHIINKHNTIYDKIKARTIDKMFMDSFKFN